MGVRGRDPFEFLAGEVPAPDRIWSPSTVWAWSRLLVPPPGPVLAAEVPAKSMVLGGGGRGALAVVCPMCDQSRWPGPWPARSVDPQGDEQVLGHARAETRVHACAYLGARYGFVTACVRYRSSSCHESAPTAWPLWWPTRRPVIPDCAPSCSESLGADPTKYPEFSRRPRTQRGRRLDALAMTREPRRSVVAPTFRSILMRSGCRGAG